MIVKNIFLIIFLFISTSCTAIPICNLGVIKYKLDKDAVDKLFHDIDEKTIINVTDTFVFGYKCKFY